MSAFSKGIFGKIILKSYLLRVIGLNKDDIRIPIGKWGDIGAEPHGTADASVRINGNWLAIEVKLARFNIAHKTKGQTEPNWAFNNILRSPSKTTKNYDILFAAGISVLGFENPAYWDHFCKTIAERAVDNPKLSENVLPHEPEFLDLCGAFVLPFSEILNNHFRVTLRALHSSQFYKYFSPLSNVARCKQVWANALTATTFSSKC